MYRSHLFDCLPYPSPWHGTRTLKTTWVEQYWLVVETLFPILTQLLLLRINRTHVNSPGTATIAKEPIVTIWTSTMAGCHGRGESIYMKTEITVIISKQRKHLNMSYEYFPLPISHVKSANSRVIGTLAYLMLIIRKDTVLYIRFC